MAKHDNSGIATNPVEQGAAGGRARASAMTAIQRREAAQRAADARWGRNALTAEYVGTLEIDQITLDCAVLPTGQRIISQGSIMGVLGRSESSGRRTRNENRPPFVEASNLVPFFPENLADKFARIEYRLPDLKGVRQGYDAEILPLVCEAYLSAREAGVLQAAQLRTAQAAEVLVRGLARVGIIALVDEATGYQDVRQRDVLAKILEEFVAKELQPWVKTFPPAFYAEMFRLRGLDYRNDNMKRPQYFGRLTNNVVYERLAPGVLDELRSKTPRDESGRPKARYHQQLTPDVGHPKLREHLASVVAIMKLSDDWPDFIRKLDRIHPRYGDTRALDMNL